jgi:hypothetical protein
MLLCSSKRQDAVMQQQETRCDRTDLCSRRKQHHTDVVTASYKSYASEARPWPA